MSQPLTSPPASREPEADVYATVKFRFTDPSGKPGTLEGDCLMNATIEGLKMQYAVSFGLAKKQNWYYKGVLLSDTETFEKREIDSTADVEIEVRTSTE